MMREYPTFRECGDGSDRNRMQGTGDLLGVSTAIGAARRVRSWAGIHAFRQWSALGEETDGVS
ncbi:hypothetical protein ACFL0Q_04235 [Thermodesulfobacteriota bacterium]